jgi:6-phosphofructokinase 1
MAGRTKMVVGNWRAEFTHVPIAAAVSQRKQIDTRGKLWTGVISTTGQARELV